jgi:hypothetical protein
VNAGLLAFQGCFSRLLLNPDTDNSLALGGLGMEIADHY